MFFFHYSWLVRRSTTWFLSYIGNFSFKFLLKWTHTRMEILEKFVYFPPMSWKFLYKDLLFSSKNTKYIDQYIKLNFKDSKTWIHSFMSSQDFPVDFTLYSEWCCISQEIQLPIWRRSYLRLWWRVWNWWTCIYKMFRGQMVSSTRLHKYSIFPLILKLTNIF